MKRHPLLTLGYTVLVFVLAVPGTAMTAEDAVIARVLGRDIRASELEPPAESLPHQSTDPDWLKHVRMQRLLGLIATPLVEKFAVERSIEVSEAEVDEFMKLSEYLEKIPDLQKARKGAGRAIRVWKTQKAMHELYGGRAIQTPSMYDPVDALRGFLTDEEKKGSFSILDGQARDLFDQVLNPTPDNFPSISESSFMSEEQTREYFKIPWWRLYLENNPAPAKKGAS